jgi:hypothetical protein
MAIRSDVTVEWRSSPRVISVPDPSTDISVQDLYDTLSLLEAEQENLQWDKIVSAGGKESLGGGQLVGLTLTLLNAQIVWGDRASPVVTRITGGNIVAVDDLGADIDVLLFSANVNCFIAQSSSATVSDQALQKETRYLIESLRETHYGWGSSFYWDPVLGSNANNGLLPEDAVATFAYAKTLTTAGHSDIIYCISRSGPTVVTEHLDLDVENLILRGAPGVVTIATDDSSDAVTISAPGVELSGFYIIVIGPTPRSAIKVTAARSKIKSMALLGGQGAGVTYDNGQGHHFLRNLVRNFPNGNGVTLENSEYCIFSESRIGNCACGLELINTGAAGTNNDNTFEAIVFDNNTNSIKIGVGVEHAIFASSCIMTVSNGAIIDNGTDSYFQSDDHNEKVWSHSKALTVGKFIALK